MAGLDKAGLEAMYHRAVQEARAVVAAEHGLEEVAKGEPDYPGHAPWREVWRIAVRIDGRDRKIVCGIPHAFPDRLPSIFLCAGDLEEWGDLPHVDNYRFLCTFDAETIRVNADRPGEIVLAVVNQAVTILEAGIHGRNQGDYVDELKAYWDKAVVGKAVSLVTSTGSSRTVSRLRLNPSWGRFAVLFAETKTEGERWLANVGYRGKIRAEDALYLPLSSLGNPPFPATNAEISEALTAAGGGTLDALHSFLSGRPRPCTVLAAVEVAGGSVALAWEHPAYRHVVHGRSGPRGISGAVPGFRNGHCPPHKELTEFNGAGRLIRIGVERVDPDRLFRRTVGTAMPVSERETAVIGCGSLGGFVADQSVRAGISSNLVLVDPQVLEPENVWRHFCGMESIGLPKAKAVATALQAHFPHLHIRTFGQGVLDLLAERQDALQVCSPIIHTVGIFAVDRRMNDLFHVGALGNGPLCLMWVEPGLVAGHALLMFPDQAGCFECLLDKEELLFEGRAIVNPGSLGMREAGCQTSYQAFGAVDLSSFVSGAVRFIARHKDAGRNLRYTWYGDLDAARAKGIGLNSRLERVPSFTEEVVQIKPFQGCPVCQAK